MPRFYIGLTILRLSIIGGVLIIALPSLPVSYPIELKLLVVASFVLAGVALSFGKRGALPGFALICFWWLACVLLFIGNDFGVVYPAGDGAKATVVLLFGWVPPAMIVVCNLLIQFLLSRLKAGQEGPSWLL